MKIDERHNIIIFEENDYDVDGYINFSRKIKKFKDANPLAEDLLVLVDFKEEENLECKAFCVHCGGEFEFPVM